MSLCRQMSLGRSRLAGVTSRKTHCRSGRVEDAVSAESNSNQLADSRCILWYRRAVLLCWTDARLILVAQTRTASRAAPRDRGEESGHIQGVLGLKDGKICWKAPYLGALNNLAFSRTRPSADIRSASVPDMRDCLSNPTFSKGSVCAESLGYEEASPFPIFWFPLCVWSTRTNQREQYSVPGTCEDKLRLEARPLSLGALLCVCGYSPLWLSPQRQLDLQIWFYPISPRSDGGHPLDFHICHGSLINNRDGQVMDLGWR